MKKAMGIPWQYKLQAKEVPEGYKKAMGDSPWPQFNKSQRTL
ncbi:hypothetical protein [Clostridium thermarum]|nr:hypothetical protein [Clostridium thermarum]